MKRISTTERYDGGFTLIEVMIAVIIIGILSAMAYASYTGSIVKSRRSDAQRALLNIAQLEERFLTECNTYTINLTGAKTATCSTSGLAASATSPDGYYTIAIDTPTTGGGACDIDTCFSVTATPVSTKSQRKDGGFRLNSLGQKFWDRNGNTNFAEAGETGWGS